MENNSATIVKAVTLQPRHATTGKTTHHRYGELITKPARLIIVHFSGGYNLIHLDAVNEELTDTFHETVDDAMAQAAFEFSIEPEEWIDTNSPY